MESISQERKTIMALMDGIDNVEIEAERMRSLLQIACNEIDECEQWVKACRVDFPTAGVHVRVLLDCLLDKTFMIINDTTRATKAFNTWSATRKAQEDAKHLTHDGKTV